LGLSYRYLGRLFGVSEKAVRKWIKGEAKPRKYRMSQISVMLNDLVEANSYSTKLDHFSIYHMGPPDNQFSFKQHDPPLVKKALGMLVHYADLLDIKNRVLLDTAGLYIRKYLKEKRVKRAEIAMFSLATLKVAMLKHRYTWDVKHLIEDRDLYDRFFSELALKYLAD
jgi:L-fucose isomerase-like protein